MDLAFKMHYQAHRRPVRWVAYSLMNLYSWMLRIGLPACWIRIMRLFARHLTSIGMNELKQEYVVRECIYKSNEKSFLC